MNRTIEQWQEVVGSGQHTSVLGYAVQDLQELARLLDDAVLAMEEVLRISDRQHDAWDAAKAAIAKIKESKK